MTSPEQRRLPWPTILGSVGLLALALFLMRPVLSGGIPIVSDHMAHFFQAWDLWEHRLFQGRISGWSDWWFMGYPAGDLYHHGVELWTVTWRFLTLTLLSWEATYSLAFVAYFALSGLAFQWFGHRTVGWLAGFVAGCLWLLDLGEYEHGGWLYFVRAGVWTQGLSMAFFLLGLAWLWRALESGRARDHALAASALGFSILCFPVTLVLLVAVAPLPFLARLLVWKPPKLAMVASFATIALLAAGLAAYWWIPMASRAAWTEPVGTRWLGIQDIAAGLLRGDLFYNVHPAVLYAAYAGGVLALLRRRAVGVLLLLFPFLLLLSAGDEIGPALGRLTESEALARFQFKRFTVPAKACLFLLAGYSVQSLWDGARALARWDRVPPGARKVLGPAIPLLFLAVAAGLLTWQAPALRTRLDALDLPTAGQGGRWDSYQQLNAWVRERKAEHPGFWRIAYEEPEFEQFFWSAPVYNGVPGYKPGFNCCRIFGLIPRGNHTALYKLLSIRYVVSDGPLAPRAGLRPLVNFQEFQVYDFTGFQADRYGLDGPGRVETVAFEPEHIALRIADTDGQSSLRLHVAAFDRWSATLDGQQVPVYPAPPYAGTEPVLMNIPVQDGLLELSYHRRAVDWIGILLTMLSLAGAGWLMLRGRRPFPKRKLA